MSKGCSMRLLKILLASLVITSLSACLSTKTYPDPQYRKASIASMGTFSAPVKVRLEVVFQRNGKNMPQVIKTLRPMAEKHLTNSGAFILVTDSTAPVLRFTLNNVANLDDAMKKGFVTGLTFGGKGSTVTDYYEAKIELMAADGKQTKNYKHALVTTIGNADAPVQGVAPLKTMDAFNVVVQDIIMNFVQDMKTDGKLSKSEVKFVPVYAIR